MGDRGRQLRWVVIVAAVAILKLRSVLGHRTAALGVEKFGESGTIADLYAIHAIDTASIIETAQELLSPRASQKRQLKAS